LVVGVLGAKNFAVREESKLELRGVGAEVDGHREGVSTRNNADKAERAEDAHFTLNGRGDMR
jgi:hypothetical protein